MNLVAGLLNESWVQHLGWVLIHFLWQGTAIALLLSVALRVLTRASSHLRYLVIGGALLLCGAAPMATWASLGSGTLPATSTLASPPSSGGTGLGVFPTESPVVGSFQEHGTAWAERFYQAASTLPPYLAFFWLAGVLILTTRLALGWTWMQRMCRSGSLVQDRPCLERFQFLLERMRIKIPVRLLQSALVEVPTLIGWMSPIILIPASVFAGLSPEQLDAILAHELAHVRRYDYLVNFFQTVIETVLFYHPAIWWISRKLREERENCCDDIALDVMEDRIVYASALAQLEAKRAVSLALNASGGSLLHRIKRIVGIQDRKASVWPMVVLMVSLLAMVCLTESKAVEPNKSAPRAASSADLQSQMIKAVRSGDVTMVQKLIAQGVDPKTIKSADRPTLLFDAGSPQVAELLIAHGVDPKITDARGGTALNTICINGGKNAAATARVLLQHGADPNARDGELATTPIMGARNKDLVDVLVEFGADIKARDSEGDNAVFWSAWWDASTIDALVRHGAPFDPQLDGPKVLIHAAQNNNVPVAEWLLDHGVNPNIKGSWDKEGKFQTTPLQAAATGGSFVQRPEADDEEEMIKLLLKHGAKVTNEMTLALNDRRPRIVKIFWESGARTISVLAYEISQGASFGEVKKLLDQGFPADPPEDRQITPLSVAAGLGRMDLVQLLIRHGADVNKGEPLNPEYPDYKPTPLVSAASAGQDGMVDYLVRHGAQPTPNAVYVAASGAFSLPGRPAKDHFEQCVKLLIDAGALKNRTPEQGGKLLSEAMETGGMGGNATVLKMLLNAGLSPQFPMPSREGQKEMTVLAYYQNSYNVRKGDYRSPDKLKELLEMLEDADKAGASKQE